MAKKETTTASVAPEHTTIKPVRGNRVRMTADIGWKLRSKNTGHTFRTIVTAHVAGYDVIED